MTQPLNDDSQNDESQPSSLQDLIRRSASAVDDFIDIRWRKIKKRFGWEGTPTIQPYVGFANDRYAWFHGRVLANPPNDLPELDDQWWDNLFNIYQRFESDEVPDVKVEIDFAGQRHIAVTDAEGYFHLETESTPEVRDQNPWKRISMRIVDHESVSPEQSTVMSRMMTPTEKAQFGIISDIDDTVLHTGITDLLTAAKLTFLHNARTRKPLPGVAGLYRAMQSGVPNTSLDGYPQLNPIFYVSSSPWNIFDLLEDFLELNDIPDGPILLRDLGFDENKFLKEGHDHKLKKVRRIMQAFPKLPFVLFGDSGQEDAELYTQAAIENPAMVKAIFIRDVDPNVDGALDAKVRSSIQKCASVGVPMHAIQSSGQAAEVLAEMKLISKAQVKEVCDLSDVDQLRPVI